VNFFSGVYAAAKFVGKVILGVIVGLLALAAAVITSPVTIPAAIVYGGYLVGKAVLPPAWAGVKEVANSVYRGAESVKEIFSTAGKDISAAAAYVVPTPHHSTAGAVNHTGYYREKLELAKTPEAESTNEPAPGTRGPGQG
jgi:phosphoenolpyruvate carboxylase